MSVTLSWLFVNRGDRAINLGLFALAIAAWLGLGYVVTSYYPTGSASALLAGALLIGVAIGLTVAPLFWLASFVGAKRIAYRGSWWRAARRAGLCALVASLFVLMRGQGVFSVPLALFIVAMAVLVELTLSLRG
jgi:hypothetical protein